MALCFIGSKFQLTSYSVTAAPAVAFQQPAVDGGGHDAKREVTTDVEGGELGVDISVHHTEGVDGQHHEDGEVAITPVGILSVLENFSVIITPFVKFRFELKYSAVFLRILVILFFLLRLIAAVPEFLPRLYLQLPA